MLDIKIINGKIVDGTGSPFFYGEVGIRNDKIVKVDYSIDEAAKNVIDVNGKVIAPGFIDAHSHSDFPLLINKKAESKIRMGVTTEVIGQCGNSAAPKTPNKKDFFGYDLDDLGVEFQTMKEYLDILETKKVAVNVNGISESIVFLFTGNSLTRPEAPNISKTFAILLPKTFPIAISELPLKLENIFMISSGADVPNETSVRPIIKSLTLYLFAIDEEPSTNKSAPFINK